MAMHQCQLLRPVLEIYPLIDMTCTILKLRGIIVKEMISTKMKILMVALTNIATALMNFRNQRILDLHRALAALHHLRLFTVAGTTLTKSVRSLV